jgi:kynurenine 3-monooxygenase
MTAADIPQFTIIGSGLAGALMACYLGKAGHRADLYEKRPDPRGHEQERGRSINLALSVRGLHALREVGIADEVLRAAVPLCGRMMHARTGQLTFQPYGKDETECLHSVSRADLNLQLIRRAARYDGVRCFFGQKCLGLDLRTAKVEMSDEKRQITHVPFERLIGADGVYSAVRAQLQKQDRFDYRQDYLAYGYKELHIPPDPGGTFPMEKQALHIWPRRSFMMIALPNLDGSFTCTLFLPYEGPDSFATLRTPADVLAYFQEQFPDAVPLMPTLAEDYFQNPVGPLVTIRCQPWYVDSRVVLLGDACHAVVPFLGQGMNAAFEDCTVLHQCLVQKAPDWEAAFREYQDLRKENVDTLADLCLDNFIEMRDKVRSRWFLLKKKFDNLLHKVFPRWYLPLYTMISFTRIPYAQARRRAKMQGLIVWAVIGALALLLLILIGLLVT